MRVGGRRLELAPHNCFACGTLNAHGLQLELHAGDDRCWVELTLADRFEGWEGMAHGGIVCTILDEVMAWALVDHDIWGVTARMHVDFKRPVPIGRPIRGEGRVKSARRRLVEAEGIIIDPADGSVLARAEATFVGASETRRRSSRPATASAWPTEPDLPELVVSRGAAPGSRRRRARVSAASLASGSPVTATAAASERTQRARALVAERKDVARALGSAAGDLVNEPARWPPACVPAWRRWPTPSTWPGSR